MQGIVASAVLRAVIAASVLAGDFYVWCALQRGHLGSPISFAEQSEPPNSILVFAGRMSTTDIWSTMAYNSNKSGAGPYYDNYIVGAAYDRDLLDLSHGFYFGGEVESRTGLATTKCAAILSSCPIRLSNPPKCGPARRSATQAFSCSISFASVAALRLD